MPADFARGDAIAGLLIMFVTLIGGMAIGMLQHSLSFADASKIYALLVICQQALWSICLTQINTLSKMLTAGTVMRHV